MSESYLLRVSVPGTDKPKKRGTCWFLSKDIVVTAAHVVTTDSDLWLSDVSPSVCYSLVDSSASEINLRPLVVDKQSDLAFLSAEQYDPGGEELNLAPYALPARKSTWRSRGYPATEGASFFPLSGTVTDVAYDGTEKSLNLKVEQGTDKDYSGMSGAPILDDDNRVFGVMTKVAQGANTIWAAAIVDVQSLLRFVQAASFQDEFTALINRLYESKAAILKLKEHLGTITPAAETSQNSARKLVEMLWRYGISGMRRAVERIASDHPDDKSLSLLNARFAGYLRRGRLAEVNTPEARSRAVELDVAKRLQKDEKMRDAVNTCCSEIRNQDTPPQDLAAAIMDMPVEDILDKLAQVQLDKRRADSLCELVELLLTAMLDEDQESAVDLILESQLGHNNTALIELPVGLHTVAEIIMAAADGRPARFLPSGERDQLPAIEHGMESPPEVGMTDDKEKFDKAFDQHLIDEIPTMKHIQDLNRADQIDVVAKELEYLAKHKRSRYMIIANYHAQRDFLALQEHFKRVKQRYPALVCLYLRPSNKGYGADYRKYRPLGEIVANTDRKAKDQT